MRSLGTNGYVRLTLPNHPLAVRSYVYEHRAVLYDAIGPGEHPCHWCQRLVSWQRGRMGSGVLVPDHLDGDKANNNRANLVPACHDCNVRRGAFMRWLRDHSDDPTLWALLDSYRKLAV